MFTIVCNYTATFHEAEKHHTYLSKFQRGSTNCGSLWRWSYLAKKKYLKIFRYLFQLTKEDKECIKSHLDCPGFFKMTFFCFFKIILCTASSLQWYINKTWCQSQNNYRVFSQTRLYGRWSCEKDTSSFFV